MLTLSRIFKLDYCLWPSLYIKMLKMQISIINYWNWTLDIIHAWFLKKTQALALIAKQLIRWQWNYKNCYMFTVKMSIIYKNFESKPTTNFLRLEALHLITKFGSIANTLRLNITKSLRLSFLVFDKCYT